MMVVVMVAAEARRGHTERQRETAEVGGRWRSRWFSGDPPEKMTMVSGLCSFSH
ncbi:hypothetical protein Hanom_Chr10g00909141 [Helianthus anomalus]